MCSAVSRSCVASCVVALALAACASPGDAIIDVVFDPCATSVAAADGSTEAEIAAIDAALRVWNDAAGLALRRVARDSNGPVVEVTFAPSIAGLFGHYDDELGTILVNRGIQDARRRALTIAHELGHAFGLLHVPTEKRVSLMNPGAPEVTPTPEDVEELRAIWGDCRGAGFSKR